jgi:hypothetical protein
MNDQNHLIAQRRIVAKGVVQGWHGGGGDWGQAEKKPDPKARPSR